LLPSHAAVMITLTVTNQTERKRPAYVVMLVAGAVMLAVGGLVAIVLFALHRTPGKEIASTHVVPGEAFMLDAVATERPVRVWMEIDCELCSNTVATGHLEVSAGGKVVASHRFDEGGTYLFAGGNGGRMSLRGDLLFSVPALPAGSPITLNGMIALHSPNRVTVWPPSHFGENTRSPAKLHIFRVFLAP
jgi:hypothetical protein